jgi:hypothetical protein
MILDLLSYAAFFLVTASSYGIICPQAAAHELMRIGRRDVFSVERDGSAEFGNQAGDRLDQGRFAGAIRSEDGDDLAHPDPKADAPYDRSTGFVTRPQLIDGEDRRTHGPAPPR